MPERVVDVYTDVSIGPRCIGVGVVMDGLHDSRFTHTVCLGPGLSPAEAETAAVLYAMRLLKALAADARVGEAHFFTDCETTVRALFDLGKLRSQVTKNFVKAVLRDMNNMKQNDGITACLRLISSRNNPAHPVSRKARREWNDLLSCKHED